MEVTWSTSARIPSIATELRAGKGTFCHGCPCAIKVRILLDEKKHAHFNCTGCRVNSSSSVTYSKGFYRHREHVQYTCTNHSTSSSINESVRCLDGQLSKEPICHSSKRWATAPNACHRSFSREILVTCAVPHMLFLRNIANTSLPSGALIDRDASFSYLCMQDYQPMMDSGVVVCLDNGQLSHQPHCTPISCREHPPSTMNGRTIFHSTKHGSLAKYRCFPGYRLENNHLAKLTCQFGQWLPKQPPKCLPSMRSSLFLSLSLALFDVPVRYDPRGIAA